MSKDREVRQRLEEVQTRLRDLGPELELTETPGFHERVDQLQRAVKEARHGARELEERLAWVRGEVEKTEGTMKSLALAAQAEQTNSPPGELSAVLFIAGVSAIIWLIDVVATRRVFSQSTAAIACLGCAFAVGLVIRARVKPRRREPPSGPSPR